MSSDLEIAKMVVATIFAKIANETTGEGVPPADVPLLDVSHFTSEPAAEVVPLADVPYVDVSQFTIESEFGSSDEEDIAGKSASCPPELRSEASHDTMTSRASLWSQLSLSGVSLGSFDKTCERYANICVEKIDNWKAAADRRVDNLKLVERYEEFDKKIGQKVSDTVDVVGQKVESLTAKLGQKVGNSVDQAKRSGAFQVATHQKDRAQRLFDSSAKQIGRVDADLTKNFDSLRNKVQAAVIGLPSKLRPMANSGGA